MPVPCAGAPPVEVDEDGLVMLAFSDTDPDPVRDGVFLLLFPLVFEAVRLVAEGCETRVAVAGPPVMAPGP